MLADQLLEGFPSDVIGGIPVLEVEDRLQQCLRRLQGGNR